MSELKREFYPNAKTNTNKIAIALLANKTEVILSEEEGKEFYEFACEESGRKLKMFSILWVTGRFPNSEKCWYYTFTSNKQHVIRVVDETYFTAMR